jgi:CDP-diacylglycerol--glycerol-3-phosphate 3-phosphatidyltransferase
MTGRSLARGRLARLAVSLPHCWPAVEIKKSGKVVFFRMSSSSTWPDKEAPIPTNTRQDQMPAARLQLWRKSLAAGLTRPVVSVLARTGITPDMVTWCGFVLTLVSAVLAAAGYLFTAGWVMLLSGFFDIIDGALARSTNRVTKFGGVLDSTLDRLSEAAILLGIMAYFLFHSGSEIYQWIVLLTGLTMIFSFLVSYIRSRAEAAGIDCQVGIFTRAERVIILALGLLIGLNLSLAIALILIAVLSAETVVQRLVFVYQQAKIRRE